MGVEVKFTEEKDAANKTSQRICPSCKKSLSNTSKAMLAKPCGHVLCKNCVSKFILHFNSCPSFNSVRHLPIPFLRFSSTAEPWTCHSCRCPSSTEADTIWWIEGSGSYFPEPLRTSRSGSGECQEVWRLA